MKKDKNTAPASLDDEKLGTPAPKKNYQQEEDADVKEKNKVKEICDYWKEHNEIYHENKTITDISNEFNCCNLTVSRYLTEGSKLGWCNYNSKEEVRKNSKRNGLNNGKQVEIFKNGKSLGVFPSCAELERQSEELFGTKLLNSAISGVCNGRYKLYKGFVFKYVDYGLK